jgi:hypothetical protein
VYFACGLKVAEFSLFQIWCFHGGDYEEGHGSQRAVVPVMMMMTMMMIMKDTVFWDITPRGSCKNRRLGGTYLLLHQSERNQRDSVFQLLVTANVPSSLNLFTLMMEAISCSETSVLTRSTRRHIQEDDILHSHRRENLKSYMSSYLFKGVSIIRIYRSNKTRVHRHRHAYLISNDMF